MDAGSEGPCTLAVVVDVNPASWTRCTQNGDSDGRTKLTLVTLGEHLALFLNAFRAVNSRNDVAVVACQARNFKFVLRAEDRPQGPLHRDLIPSLHAVAHETESLRATTALSAAFSAALCHLRRTVGPAASTERRAQVLVISATPDDASQFNSLMNCIFAAEAMDIVIDALVLHGNPSPFLQQATYLTSGVHMHPSPEGWAGLSELLIAHALPSKRTREKLAKPEPHDVDFRAACLLTHRMLDNAYACSVCLSLFHHNAVIQCPTCGTRFKPPRIAKKRKARA